MLLVQQTRADLGLHSLLTDKEDGRNVSKHTQGEMVQVQGMSPVWSLRDGAVQEHVWEVASRGMGTVWAGGGRPATFQEES